jgi:hypothetical protein
MKKRKKKTWPEHSTVLLSQAARHMGRAVNLLRAARAGLDAERLADRHRLIDELEAQLKALEEKKRAAEREPELPFETTSTGLLLPEDSAQSEQDGLPSDPPPEAP